jgi:hypothetical protein
MIILTSCFTMDKGLEWVTSQNAGEETGLLPLPTGLIISEMPHPWDLPNTFIFLRRPPKWQYLTQILNVAEKKNRVNLSK